MVKGHALAGGAGMRTGDRRRRVVPQAAQRRDRSYYMARTGLSGRSIAGLLQRRQVRPHHPVLRLAHQRRRYVRRHPVGAPDLTVSQIRDRIKEVVRNTAFCRTNRATG